MFIIGDKLKPDSYNEVEYYIEAGKVILNDSSGMYSGKELQGQSYKPEFINNAQMRV